MLLWQHLFWFFGHPEVYLIFIPALGFMSSIIPTFSRRPIFGYSAMVLVADRHRLPRVRPVGAPHVRDQPARARQELLHRGEHDDRDPVGVQIFCWIATLVDRQARASARRCCSCSRFFFILVLGGMTGLMLAAVPLDLQVHDTYFVVAHLHYVLIGGAVFPLFGAFYYWFPKITGRMLSERLGRWNFWLFFIGFNVTFFPMHLLGLQGMPRRV